ncbi:hypothetical protein B0A52_01717 [Exophiala mesophila]|uniref:Integral membrane protein n=1 Tax=Exophiala mesophila TaxID=212818 RepID=A0A438NFU7_EXOME|nr:hypothetical protein B0A52_01717 [Exophiala mesophila]
MAKNATPTSVAKSRTSESNRLLLIAGIFATIWTGFGINALLRPMAAYSIFEFPVPIASADQAVIEGLMLIYGARDLFMGFAVLITALLGSRRACGYVVLAGAAVAFVDGWACLRVVGDGQWNHWGYAPALVIVGALMAGVLD